MNPVKIISGIAAPFLRINVDTDAIIPSREIKAVSKKGLSEGLFSEWRYASVTERKPNDDFILNQDPYNRSLMLLTGDNFGCGSSREHAPIALSTCGIKAVIAVSFARIFYRNSVDGAFLLPIEIDEKTYQTISNNDELEIDVEKNEIKNISKNETYSMKPFSEIIAKIISAGGLFKYKK